MKLFYAPGACSLGIHVLLEELGQPYGAEAIDLRAGAQHSPEYKAVNPKSKVPALLRDDGTTLTEYGAISHYLADATPLVPQGRDAQSRANEAIDYIVSTIHMQGFSRLFRPANFAPGAADEAAVKQRGREIAGQGFAVLAQTLADQEYLVGSFSHADCALFYVERWGAAMGLDLPAPIASHLARMMARAAVAAVLAAEGIH